jgi:hypothetical protein
MQKTPNKYINTFGLLALITWGIITGFGFFEGQTFSIIGFFLSLFFFLNTLDKILLFKNIKKDLWLLIGYMLIISVLLYLFFPYGDHRKVLSPFWSKWYIETIAAVGYAPALISRALNQLFDIPFSYVLFQPRTHYPFAVGFWLFWVMITITIRFYGKVSTVVHLLLIYNFIIGLIAAIWLKTAGAILLGASVLAWIYIFFPRFGIPTVFKTKRQQREIRKAGKDIKRAEKRMKKVLEKIDKI